MDQGLVVRAQAGDQRAFETLAAAAYARLYRLAHGILRLRDLSRVDFILDTSGLHWCLEANSLPGMTSNSLVPKAARATGIAFPELCHRLAEMALKREM